MLKVEVKGKVLVPLRWMVYHYFYDNLVFPPEYAKKSRTAPVIQGKVFEYVEDDRPEEAPLFMFMDSKTGHIVVENLRDLDSSECERFQVTIGGRPVLNIENPMLITSNNETKGNEKIVAHNQAMLALLGKHNDVIIRDMEYNPYPHYYAAINSVSRGPLVDFGQLSKEDLDYM